MSGTNNIGELNAVLFAEIDRLRDGSLTGDRLKEEITTRANAINGLARQVNQVATLQLRVAAMVNEYRDLGEKLAVPPALHG